MYNPAIADMVSMAGSAQRGAMGGEIITKTLDALNSTGFGGLHKSPVGIANTTDYQFQTSVLNAAYSGKGTFVDVLL